MPEGRAVYMIPCVAVLGLGYVGFPLAQLLVKSKRYRVLGFDIEKAKLFQAKQNLASPRFFLSDDPQRLREADILVVCVPTPVNELFHPDYGPLKSACRFIAKNLKKGALVIIESTINPGTCEEIVIPLFRECGFSLGKDFFLAHCPERIDPGNKKWGLSNIPRNVGGSDAMSAQLTAQFYRSFIQAPIKVLSCLKAAEATKIVENTFRDINIAYVNELAMSFDTLGIDLLEVIEGAKTKPFAFMAHYPGIGVGGHCIPVDPYYLIERASHSGFEHRFLKMARDVNHNMPAYAIHLLQRESKKIGLALEKITVGLLGLAYKKDIDDIRESPALKVLEILKKKKIKVLAFDPWLVKISTAKNLESLLKQCKAIILATNHTCFEKMPLKFLVKYGVKLVIDGRNCLPKEKIKELGIHYKGIGR